LNDYIYAGNNPIRYIDPSGQMLIGVNFATFHISSFSTTNTVKSVNQYGPYVYKASNLVLKYIGHTVKELKRLKKTNPDLFKKMKSLNKRGSERMEIHHIIEKRFWKDNKILKDIFDDADDIMGVVLSRERHKVITQRWINELGRKNMKNHKEYSSITIEDLINASSKVYRDDPLQRNSVVRMLIGKIKL